MRKFSLVGVSMLALLMLLGLTASAQPGCDQPAGRRMHSICSPGGGDHGPQGHRMRGERLGHLLRMADEIGLSEEQVSKIKELQTSFQLKMVDARAALQKARIELKAAQQTANPPEATVFAAIDQISKKQAEIKKAQFSHRQQVHALLTSEQIEKIEKLKFRKGPRGSGEMFDRDGGDNEDDDDDAPHPGGGHRGW